MKAFKAFIFIPIQLSEMNGSLRVKVKRPESEVAESIQNVGGLSKVLQNCVNIYTEKL